FLCKAPGAQASPSITRVEEPSNAAQQYHTDRSWAADSPRLRGPCKVPPRLPPSAPPGRCVQAGAQADRLAAKARAQRVGGVAPRSRPAVCPDATAPRRARLSQRQLALLHCLSGEREGGAAVLDLKVGVFRPHLLHRLAGGELGWRFLVDANLSPRVAAP